MVSKQFIRYSDHRLHDYFTKNILVVKVASGKFRYPGWNDAFSSV